MGRRSRSRDRSNSKYGRSRSGSRENVRGNADRENRSDSDRKSHMKYKEVKQEFDSVKTEIISPQHSQTEVIRTEGFRVERGRRSRSSSYDRKSPEKKRKKSRERRESRSGSRERRRRSRDRDGNYDNSRTDRNHGKSRHDREPERRRRSRSNERRRDRREDEQRPSRRDDGKNYGLEVKQWGKPEEPKTEEPPIEKEKVNLGVSGKLMEDTNMFKGVVVKYSEPPEAKKPNARWRLYPFKGDESLPVLYIHRQSAYLVGRDHRVADLPVDHPSCSKQHAVIQYRSVPFEKADGTRGRKILPYIIDLGSANGTLLNDQKIEPQRYIELQDKDMLKFGFSTREYVVMKEREILEEELAPTVKEEQKSP